MKKSRFTLTVSFVMETSEALALAKLFDENRRKALAELNLNDTDNPPLIVWEHKELPR